MKVCEHVASWRVVTHAGIPEGLFSLGSAAVEDKVGKVGRDLAYFQFCRRKWVRWQYWIRKSFRVLPVTLLHRPIDSHARALVSHVPESSNRNLQDPPCLSLKSSTEKWTLSTVITAHNDDKGMIRPSFSRL